MTADLGQGTDRLRGAAALAALEDSGRLFCYAQDVADVLERDNRTILEAVKRGDIPCTKVGQRYMVPMAWLRRAVDGTGTPQLAERAS